MTYTKFSAKAAEKKEYTKCIKTVAPYSSRAVRARKHRSYFLPKILLLLFFVYAAIQLTIPKETESLQSQLPTESVSEIQTINITPDIPLENSNAEIPKESLEYPEKEVSVVSNELKSESGKTAYRVVKTDLSKNLPYNSINNETGIDVDLLKISKETVETFANNSVISCFSKEEPLVLIYHTHGTESYLENDSDFYEKGTETHSSNREKNVVAVGRVLAETLENYAIPVIHCEIMHDENSYNDSYSNSYKSVKEYLEKYPSIEHVIDLHRDAIIGKDNEMYKTMTNIGSDESAQIMFVIGSNASNKNHTGWESNLSNALKIQKCIKDTYPTLSRPINLKKATYNQQLSENSFILEVGTAGNTLEEAKTAVKYFGACFAKCILKGTI